MPTSSRRYACQHARSTMQGRRRSPTSPQGLDAMSLTDQRLWPAGVVASLSDDESVTTGAWLGSRGRQAPRWSAGTHNVPRRAGLDNYLSVCSSRDVALLRLAALRGRAPPSPRSSLLCSSALRQTCQMSLCGQDVPPAWCESLLARCKACRAEPSARRAAAPPGGVMLSDCRPSPIRNTR